MRCRKLILLLCLNFFFCCFVLSHELPTQGHVHYSFEVLKEEVNSDSLIPDEVQRLLSKLHFWNCSDVNEGADNRKVGSDFPQELFLALRFAGDTELLIFCTKTISLANKHHTIAGINLLCAKTLDIEMNSADK